MIGLGGTAIADWMVDTFIYTGLLIALVLLVRQRVAEYFGPQIAYALWALPLLRFVMPPLVLPAWMQPAEDMQAAAAALPGDGPLTTVVTEVTASPGSSIAPADMPWVDLTVTDILLPLWLVGAGIFLLQRSRNYRAMRRDLLAGARPVGEAGKVRLVETPAVSSPVAFGIRDKVVALPPEFMDRIDVRARDMAIAHELEHHRGHDLLANMAAQPLLALHWFNPLAWWGWRAMRRDQEAACDARVVAGRARSERAAYAEVIAGFAAGKHLALAAPMACPVLGEKSIIHRLRSLTMTDISTRRRNLGIAAITTTALTLPLTASISYAQPEALSRTTTIAPVAAAKLGAPVAPVAPAKTDASSAVADTAAPDGPVKKVSPAQAAPTASTEASVLPRVQPAVKADPDMTVRTTRANGEWRFEISTRSAENGPVRIIRVYEPGDSEGRIISEAEFEAIMRGDRIEIKFANPSVERENRDTDGSGSDNQNGNQNKTVVTLGMQMPSPNLPAGQLMHDMKSADAEFAAGFAAFSISTRLKVAPTAAQAMAMVHRLTSRAEAAHDHEECEETVELATA